jgi:hypothetical protein
MGWFRTFAMNVSQIYDDDGQPVEMKIELEEAANRGGLFWASTYFSSSFRRSSASSSASFNSAM